MRFVVCHARYHTRLEGLLTASNFVDVKLIGDPSEEQPSGRTLGELYAERDAPIACFSLTKEYRRALKAHCFNVVLEKPTEDELQTWLHKTAPPPALVPVVPPGRAFMVAAESSKGLMVFAEDAFARADDVTQRRQRFMTRAAQALLEYSSNPSAGRLDAYFNQRGICYASSGGVEFQYNVYHDGAPTDRPSRTCWHLKEGDRTTREDAARVYFHRNNLFGKSRVIVLYAGPHPSSGLIRTNVRFKT
ncbi:MAG: hypothetical protein EP329_14900 [Deltaproteobacteria bacterium]|nr:MAG: hypothetical protein EP329_14900 [Deltaproteobacteria bacterium]